MKLFLIAGEPSGDRLGAALMAGIKTLHPDVEILGVGGPRMQAHGLDSLFNMERLSVMGLAEVLPRLPELFGLRDQAVEAILAAQPDALISIDSPDFCLRVASRVRRTVPDLRTIHYVAPTVWAWREGRAAKMARSIDHVLALFPFEPPYMEAAGMTCDFVGHPVVSSPMAPQADVDAFRAERGDIALVLPGSRSGEIGRLAPVFGEALHQLPDDIRPVVPTLPHLVDQIRDATADWPRTPLILHDEAERLAAFGAARAALAASGTVSLELARHRVPMVIAYDMAWLSRMILSRMFKLDTVTLVNIVSETKVVPEYLGAACKPGPIGAAFARLLTVPSLRETQRDAMDVAMSRLGEDGEDPGLRAARSVLTHLAG